MNYLLTQRPNERRKRRSFGLAGLAAFVALTLPFAAQAGETHARPVLHKKALAARKAAPARSLSTVSGLKATIHALEAREHAREADQDSDKDDRDADHDNKQPATQTRLLPGGRSVPFRMEEEGGGLDALGSLLYRTQQRAYPHDTIDWKAYERAVQQRNRMPAYQLNGNVSATGGKQTQALPAATPLPAAARSWQFIGPINYVDHYEWGYGLGAMTGRVNDVTFDPQNPGVYYLAAANGGVWKTSDAGANWTPLSDQWPFLATSSIALEPGNSQVVYVGTGDYDHLDGRGTGIMKSTDGGATWTNLGFSEFGNKYISKIVIDPDNPQTVFVATGRFSGGNVWTSTDGGQNWSLSLADSAAFGYSDLRFGAPDILGQRNLYAVGNNGSSNVVYRSIDRGITWIKLTFPVPAKPAQVGAIDLCRVATSPLDPDTVYLSSGTDALLFGSADAGDNWTSLGSPPSPSPGWGQSWYDQHLESGIRYLGTEPVEYVYLSLFDIYSWSTLDSWNPVATAYQNTDQIHTDQHALSVNPNNPDELLAGNDGGIYRLTATPGTDTWTGTSLNATLGITQLYHVAVHPFDATDVIAGAQDNGSPGSRGDLSLWSLLTGGDGADVAINPINPLVQYACYIELEGLTLTTDNWLTSKVLADPVNRDPKDANRDIVAFIAPFALAPTSPNYLYAGTNYVYRYDQNTDKWAKRIGGKKLSTSAYIQAIEVAPSDSSRIYTGSLDGEIWGSRDGGALWRKLNRNPLPNLTITGIAVSPTNPASVFVTLSGTGSPHVWHCNDTSALFPIWTNISGTGITGLPDIPTNTIVIDPNFTNHYYVGTDTGVFATTNGGNTWSNASNPLGLPNVEVDELAIAPFTRYLTAGSFGRGIWRLRLDDSSLTFSITPNQVVGGASTTITATITLNSPAPAGGTVFTVNSSNNALVSYSTTVTVPAGQKKVSFPITTSPVTTKTVIAFVAYSNRGTDNATLTLLPGGGTVIGITLSATTVPGGAVVDGTVTLDGPAPAGGTSVALASDDPSIATVPGAITIAAGSNVGSFKVTTKKGGADKTVTITATTNAPTGNASVSAKLTVRAAAKVSALYLIPNFIRGANNGLAVITLDGVLDVPIVVTLTSSNPNAASVPATVTIPAGARSALFGITGKKVTTATNVTISGTANGVTVSAVLTVYP